MITLSRLFPLPRRSKSGAYKTHKISLIHSQYGSTTRVLSFFFYGSQDSGTTESESDRWVSEWVGVRFKYREEEGERWSKKASPLLSKWSASWSLWLRAWDCIAYTTAPLSLRALGDPTTASDPTRLLAVSSARGISTICMKIRTSIPMSPKAFLYVSFSIALPKF